MASHVPPVIDDLAMWKGKDKLMSTCLIQRRRDRCEDAVGCRVANSLTRETRYEELNGPGDGDTGKSTPELPSSLSLELFRRRKLPIGL